LAQRHDHSMQRSLVTDQTSPSQWEILICTTNCLLLWCWWRLNPAMC